MALAGRFGAHGARLATGTALGVVAASCLALGGWPLFVLALLAGLAAAWEFLSLTHTSLPGRIITLAALTGGMAAVQLGQPAVAVAVLGLTWWLGSLGFLLRSGSPAKRDSASGDAAGWLIWQTPASTLLYIAAPLCIALSWTPWQNALVLAGTIASDVGAYYAGHLIGGPKLWPAVSPKKTWAGSLGGLAATLALTAGAGQIWGVQLVGLDPGVSFPLWTWLALGATISVAAQLGDLFESALKRHAGVKDSGTLLPGHGGVLDRIDGLLAAAPAAGLFVFVWNML
ncbi:phosphatidate cytidylyltransferase [Megalodesulfovibrio gigas]|uniref:Phosphatidate cytidylyltransferase n=1 Tax=Megalodesulfovibrio gigas (strain ATCC 19364 / DSM 1382 / NCIMB 9332 / VKM B-1759) TaxID=1121448 RepID=T2GGE8_MEGG1|nr:phosphatidate cytidylyltransferase [Megalodesulfovibrio gigas]AGW15092.1 putative phosphatidate cytidylyltransferase [Megalodesulfovibrio gigas DSM 1382 = ATCC 19364]